MGPPPAASHSLGEPGGLRCLSGRGCQVIPGLALGLRAVAGRCCTALQGTGAPRLADSSAPASAWAGPRLCVNLRQQRACAKVGPSEHDSLAPVRQGVQSGLLPLES